MIEYQTDNIFAKILRGEIPCEKVFEDDTSIAFMDIMPQSNGHLLVVPKRASVGLLDADPDIFGQLFTNVQKLARAAKQAFHADGVTIMQFNGPAAGQTVFHLHVHIIPRYEGVSLYSHGAAPGDPEVIKSNAAKIRAALSSEI